MTGNGSSLPREHPTRRGGLRPQAPASPAAAGKSLPWSLQQGTVHRGEQPGTLPPAVGRPTHRIALVLLALDAIFPSACLDACILLSAAPAGRAFADDGPTGEQIYQQKCASCHGACRRRHEGALPQAARRRPSAAQLAQLIAETMPKDDPGTCTGADADKVAAYIHDAFYSKRTGPHRAVAADRPPAPERHRRPDRRLPQRPASGTTSAACAANTSALAASQRPARHRPARRRASISTSRTAAPTRRSSRRSSSIRWQGSVLAPETGDYEFIVRTENGVRLWVNDQNKPLIDAGSVPATTIELRGSIRLLGGRAYPLRLEFFKSKEAKEKTASVALEWKPPYGVAGPIPARDLSPNRFPETLVIAGRLSAGRPQPRLGARHDRFQGVGPGRDRRRPRNRRLRDGPPPRTGRRARRRQGPRAEAARVLPPLRRARLPPAAHRRAEAALHRPPVRHGRRPGHGRQARRAAGAAVAALPVPRSRRRLRTTTTRPAGSRSPCGIRRPTRNCSTPRPPASSATREQVRRAGRADAGRRAGPRQAARVLPPVAARSTRRRTWPRTPTRFPGFDPAVVADLRTSLDLFLDDVAWNGDSDFRQLLLADDLYLNGRLAKFYGADLPADAPFQKVKLNPQQRAGVLTHPYLMAAFAHTAATFADPPRRLPGARRPRRDAAAAAGGVHAAAGEPAPRPDDARARGPANQAGDRASRATASSTRSASRWSISTPSAASATRTTASRSMPRAPTRRGRRDGEVRRSARPGGVPGRQRRGADGVRRAAVPPPGQAAGAGVRAAGSWRSCGSRSPRMGSASEAAGGGGDRGGADGAGGEDGK